MIKKTSLFLMGWVMIGSFSLSAQDRKLTLQYLQKNKIPTETRSLKASLNYLEEVFDVTLTYKSHLVEDKFIRLENIYEQDFHKTINELLKPANLKYEKIGARSFVILPDEKPLLKKVRQDTTVRGEVIDASTEETLPGVNVLLKGTTEGTATSSDGTFELTVESLQDTLVFSFVGYQTAEIPINGRTDISVTLESQAVTGEELVVVGYGTTSRTNLTTSISSVQGDEMVERPTAINVSQGLAGKVAGVNVMSNSGKPGGKPSIIIRGVGSINTSSDPLYVVDGIVGIDPTTIDPNIIESVDILKDAASTAIYGARGANGVVVITTKQSRGTTTDVTYNGSLGFGSQQRKVNLLNAEQVLELYERKYDYPYRADPSTERYGPHEPDGQNFTRKDDLFNEDGTPKYNTDWQEQATRLAVSHNHALTFSGGTDELNALANVSYRNNEGIMLNSYRQQISGYINLGWNVKPWLNIQASLNGGADQRNNIDLNPLSSTALRKMYEMLPFLPVQYPDGTYSRQGDYPGAENSENPVRLLKEIDNVVGRTYTLANIIGTFELTDELDVVGIFGAQTEGGYDFYYAGTDLLGVSSTQDGIARRNHNNRGSWNIESYVNYVNTFHKHNIDLVGGASWYFTRTTATTAETQGFFDDYFRYSSLSAGSVTIVPSSSPTGNQLNSFYSRANYNYDERYLLGSSFRLDGSSRFGENNKYGNFFSFSAGWNISNEAFFGDNLSEIISNLKIRGSWGAVGNAEIGDYVTLPRLTNQQSVFNDQTISAVTLGSLGNPDLTWESSEQLDIGLDLGLFNNRINITADYYIKTNRDLLYQKELPITTGFQGVFDNIGDIRNRGIEIAINTLNVTTNDLRWNTTMNFSRNISKVLNLNGDEFFPAGRIRVTEGRPLNEFYGYVRDGIWGEDDQSIPDDVEPGDIRYVDTNENGIKDPGDRQVLGQGRPDFEANMVNTFSYKGISLMIDLQSMYGHSISNGTKALMNGAGSADVNSYVSTLENSWSPDNPNGSLAALRLPGDHLSENEVDDYAVEDATFLRVRNVSLSYRVDAEWISRFLVKDLTLGVSIENALLFTRYSGMDPEFTSFDPQLQQGIDFYQYPKPRTISFSLKARF